MAVLVFLLFAVPLLTLPIIILPNIITKAVVADFPFLLGTAKGPENKPVPLMTYTFGNNPGTVPIDGIIHDLPLSETFARFETHPATGHPDGTAYFWVYDDTDNIYFAVDWTSDDTYDDGDDYFAVHIDDGTGLKTYRQNTEPVGGDYGTAVFGDTQTADYTHMWYAMAVPKSELSSETLKVGFELYGTAGVTGQITWDDAPISAEVGIPVDFIFDFVFEGGCHGNNIALLLSYEDDGDLLYLSENYMFIGNGHICNDHWNYPDCDIYDGDILILSYAAFETSDENIPETGKVTVSHTFTEAGTYKLAVKLYWIDEGDGLDGLDGVDIGFHWDSCAPSYLITEVTVNEPSDTLIPAEPITGVTSPAGGGVPSEDIDDGERFTASIEWEDEPILFAYETVYTAYIILTADVGYTFIGGYADTAEIAGFTVNGIPPSELVRNDGFRLVFKVTFPPTEPEPTSTPVPTGIPGPDPKITTINKFNDGDTAFVGIGLSRDEIGGDTVTVAVYDAVNNGKLLEAVVLNPAEHWMDWNLFTVEIPVGETAELIKVMWWDGTDSMLPLCRTAGITRLSPYWLD